MKIGVVSDTHLTKDSKLPSEITKAFAQVDLIIHAGDIVADSVIKQLEKLAAVKAVSGNMDTLPLKRKLPERLNIELKGYTIGVLHGHNLRGHIMHKLTYVFPNANIIIFGHTHQPINKWIGKQLYFNPGSPTDKRLQSHYSYGIITLDNKITAKVIKFK